MGTSTKNHSTLPQRRAKLAALKHRIWRKMHKGQPAPIERVSPEAVHVRRYSDARATRRFVKDGTLIVPVDVPFQYRPQA
jgi:hypothetical protein